MPSRSSARFVLPAAAYAVFLVSALQTLVVPIIGDIQSALDVSAVAASWIITANLLAAAVLTPVLGRLGDLHGRRRVIIGVLVVVLLGSLLAATTSSLPLLILARVMQGASFGIFPLAIGLLRAELPAAKLTGAMAIVSGMLAIGGGVALVATGLLTQDGGDYHRVFWLSAGLVAVALVACMLALPERPGHATGGVDWAGVTLLGAGLILLLMPLEQGNTWGWGSARVVGCLVAAVVALVAFVLVETKVREPLVQVSLLTRRPILVANLAGLLLGLSMFIGFLVVSTFVQTPAEVGYGFGADVLQASLVYLFPGAIAGIVTAPLGGLLVSRISAKYTLALALLIAAGAFTFLALAHSEKWEWIVGSFFINTAVTFGYAALPALIVENVSPEETGIANSVNSIARTVGSSFASALIVTLLTRNTIPGLPVAVPQEEQYVLVLVIGAAGATAATLLVLLGLKRRPAHPAPHLSALEVEEEAVFGAAGLEIPDELVDTAKHA